MSSILDRGWNNAYPSSPNILLLRCTEIYAICSMDCANWYGIQVEAAKKQQALYPAMGRKHVHFLNENRLIYDVEPRDEFRTINYLYVIDGTQVIAYDVFFNATQLGSIGLTGTLWFAYLPVGNVTYALLTNG